MRQLEKLQSEKNQGTFYIRGLSTRFGIFINENKVKFITVINFGVKTYIYIYPYT